MSAAAAASASQSATIVVNSPNVSYSETEISTTYSYPRNRIEKDGASIRITPTVQQIKLHTQRKVPKVGLMLIGLAGNNGTTVVAGQLANKLGINWETKRGFEAPNYFGSVTMSSTVRLGYSTDGEEVSVPLRDLIPLVHPNDLEIGGWDINDMDLADAMHRARVLDVDLQRQLRPHMAQLKALPSIYDPTAIAGNQRDRANNVIPGTQAEQFETIRRNIREFRAERGVDKVIVLWTATTERFCDIVDGLNDTGDNLINAIQGNKPGVLPSTIFAAAAILEGCSYINGSPQNTLVPGVIDLAEKHRVFVAGDDFKSGQTKFKSALVEFLVGAGIKPECIASYNHLGNNDGKNLSEPAQFRSKEISKTNVVDDMVASNKILYPDGEGPDHCIVIKYLPYVADSKRAMDEYTASIFMNGQQTIVVHNTCEDSLLAAPLIFDLAIAMELMERITYSIVEDGKAGDLQNFRSVATLLSYWCKAPVVPAGTPIVNALSRQKACIENLFRALIGLPPEDHLLLEFKARLPTV